MNGLEPPAGLPLHYALWRAEFGKAMDPRLFTLEHLDGLIFRREAVCFAGRDAAIVVEVKIFPTGARAMHGLVAAGALGELVLELIPAAEAWGRAQGCILALIDSREGWARIMKKHGYAPFQTAIAKEL